MKKNIYTSFFLEISSKPVNSQNVDKNVCDHWAIQEMYSLCLGKIMMTLKWFLNKIMEQFLSCMDLWSEEIKRIE
jgi:hypothetical protein